MSQPPPPPPHVHKRKGRKHGTHHIEMMKRRVLGTFVFSILHSFPSNSTIPPPPSASFSLSSPTRPLLLICVRIFAAGRLWKKKPNISSEIVFLFFFLPAEKLMDHFVFLDGSCGGGIVYVTRTNTSARTRVRARGGWREDKRDLFMLGPN